MVKYLQFLESLGLRKKVITEVGFFNAFLLACEEQNIRIRSGETAIEFVSRISLPVSNEDALFLVDQYYRIRYGGMELINPRKVTSILEQITVKK